MENQINVGDQNIQQTEQSQAIQYKNIQSEKQGKQSSSQQKVLFRFKLSRKIFWFSPVVILAILVILIGSFWNNQQYANRVQNIIPTATIPNPTTIASSNQSEWLTYKDNNVEFKYPKEWILSREGSQNIGIKCTSGLYFINLNSKDMILVVEKYKPPLQNSLNRCYANRIDSPFSREIREIKLGKTTQRIDVTTIKINDRLYKKLSYGFESDFTIVDVYNFSLIFNPDLPYDILSLFDNILFSFKYLKYYQINEPKEWKIYTSKLGFSFDYPSEWGDVTEKTTDAKIEGTGDSGKTYSLSFSVKSNVKYNYVAYATGQSSDFSAGRGVTFTDYRGNPNNSASVTSEITMGLTYRCYQYPVQYYPYLGVIKFNLPGKEINGVMLVVPILSSADMGKYDKVVDDFIGQEKSCWGPSGTESPSSTIIAKEKEIKEMLNKGVNFDEESKINLAIFKRISGSAKIL
ncbi:hypothetical protein FJY90_07310 [Candidatus Gottesmanbacteria bacterium]|nr:hypothetical protein [Candidatus Gottesmanbacteria bacterium]